MPDINDLILSELRELRTETTKGFSALLQRTAVLETKMLAVEELEPRVVTLEHQAWKTAGIATTLALAIQPVLYWVRSKF